MGACILTISINEKEGRLGKVLLGRQLLQVVQLQLFTTATDMDLPERRKWPRDYRVVHLLLVVEVDELAYNRM